jgi:hypothetical protein
MATSNVSQESQMKKPPHEQVPLRADERAEFIAITRELDRPPSNRNTGSAIGRWQRVRLAFFTHLALATLLLPIGLMAMAAALLVWWPLSLLGVGLVTVGQAAVFELIRSRHQRRRLGINPSERTT